MLFPGEAKDAKLDRQPVGGGRHRTWLLKEQREASGVNPDGSLTLRLPLPPNSLNPNARSHWTAKARAAKILRKAAELLALGFRSFANPLIEAKFYPAGPTLAAARFRDNAIARI